MIDVHIKDPRVLGAQTPPNLATYLRARGWTLAHRTDTSAFWTLPAGCDEFEVQQPLEQELRDYALRVGDALVVLAEAEGRSELEILREIAQSTWDVHTVRLFPADEPPGMVPIEDGVAAYESLRSLVAAGAYPVFSHQHRLVQPARRPQGLLEFVRAVRIGPGGEGSYSLTAHVPVPPLLSGHSTGDQEPGPPAEEPVERQVSLRLQQAIRAALAAADAALIGPDGLEPFTSAVEQGVSANLCEALAGLGGASRHSFEVSAALAAVRPHAGELAPVRFRRHHVPVLHEAAGELRARTAEEGVTVVGEVVRLYREGAGGGEITLVGRVEDQDPLRRIWLSLAGAEYELAMHAHKQMRQVTVRGDLVRRGNRSYLSGGSDFRVLGSGDD